MPRKTFANGFPLPASDLNTYLMDQSVQTYADATARTAALATPVEGQMSYLADTNTAYVYDGSSWNAVVDAKNYGATLPNGAAGRNKVLNSDFSIWQRGSSFTETWFNGGNLYTTDRWKILWNTAPTSVTVSRQAFTYGTAPVAGYEGEYFFRSTITTVGANSLWRHYQAIEDVRNFAGQTATFSFWAKADSARTTNLVAYQNFGSGGSASVNATLSASSVALTTSWQRFTITATFASIAGKTIGANNFVGIGLDQVSASGSVLDLWGVQLESGSVATPFATATGTKQGELAACQRYYTRFTSSTGLLCSAYYGNTATVYGNLPFPVEMRGAVSISASSGTDYYRVFSNNTSDYINSLSAESGTTKATSLYNNTQASGTSGAAGAIFFNNASAYVEVSSEL